MDDVGSGPRSPTDVTSLALSAPTGGSGGENNFDEQSIAEGTPEPHAAPTGGESGPCVPGAPRTRWRLDGSRWAREAATQFPTQELANLGTSAKNSAADAPTGGGRKQAEAPTGGGVKQEAPQEIQELRKALLDERRAREEAEKWCHREHEMVLFL